MLNFVRGFVAPFRGAAFIARQRLWAYLVAPVGLNILVAGGTAWLAVRWARRFLGDGAFAQSAWATVLVVFVAVALTLGLFLVLAPVVSAPFVDLLTEKVEAIVLGAPGPSVGLLAGAWDAVRHGVIKFTLYLLALAVTAGLGMLTGLGAFLGLLLYGAFVAFDGFDYPLARRRRSFGRKWAYLAGRSGLATGFAAGAGLLYVIPAGALVAPAFAAVGATLAFVEDEQRAQRM